MPELPEVETLKRELGKVLAGKKIKAFQSDKFALDLVGKKILSVERRAKILIINLETRSPSALLIHLKMTGQLIFKPKRGKMITGGHPEDPEKYTRATFDFTDGSRLHFNDLRKFGWLKLVNQIDSQKIFDAHGVEPLTKQFTFAVFNQILERYPKRKIKQILLDQALIAGLGNIYVDEACFRAHILPTRLTGSLTENKKKSLHRAIVEMLKVSIKLKGTSARNYRRANGQPGGFVPHLNVYGRAGQPCKRCQGKIVRIKLNGRGTHFCPKCQK